MSSLQKVIKYCAMGFAIFLAVSIITAISSAVISVVSLVSGTNIFHSNRDDKEVYDYEKDFTGVESLDINVSAGQLLIKQGSGFRVEAEKIAGSFEAEVSESGTLSIKDSGVGTQFLWFNFNGFHNPSSKIILYLPSDFIAEEVMLDTGAGNVEIDGLRAEYLNVSTGFGNFTGKNMSAVEAMIDGGFGSVVLEDISFEDSEFNCGLGNLRVSGELTGDCSIDCGIGNVDLDLSGAAEDYELEIDSGIGNVRVDGKKVKEGHVNNNARNYIEIDGGIGNIRVDFENSSDF
ncbi:MAG: putative rane protein [Herbinix sp.]|jgi:DUF4097 and DUF4098 domain-containing protein YvlB|nr:putative rane protein [Herbinix sp.]